MDKQVIREIQHYLRTLSFSDPRLPPIVVNGVFGPETENAVMIFQRGAGITPTGAVDSVTWERLKQAIEPSQVLPLNIFPHPNFVLRPLETHEIAQAIAWMLNVLSQYYDNISPVESNGVYNENAVDEIQKIQALHGLEENGIIDLDTWRVLATLFNHRQDTAKRWLD